MEKLSIEELFCPYCGTQLKLTGSFCANCGTSFEEMDREVTIIVRQRKFQKIMGKENFFGIEEAMKYFKVNPTDQDLNALAKIPFSEPVLKKLKDTHILVAVFPLSILDIRKMNAKLFHDDSRYNDESFAKERGKTSWQLVRKTPVPNSIWKNWPEHRELFRRLKDDEIPTTQVMVYTITGHYFATDERLFEDNSVRTSSVSSTGTHVIVQFFPSDGFAFYFYGDNWDDFYDGALGLSSARKF